MSILSSAALDAALDAEEPTPLEGTGSAEQGEWDSDGPSLSITERRIIPQQRAVWLADHYFAYSHIVERYAMHGNAVRVTFPSHTSAAPTQVMISLAGENPDADARAAFEEHFTRVIEDTPHPGGWVFTWTTDTVTATRG